jgi:hypothetical protein
VSDRKFWVQEREVLLRVLAHRSCKLRVLVLCIVHIIPASMVMVVIKPTAPMHEAEVFDNMDAFEFSPSLSVIIPPTQC